MERFVYLHACLNELHASLLPWDITKILQRLVVLGALDMPDYGNQKRWYLFKETFWFLSSCKKSNLCLYSFLPRFYNFVTLGTCLATHTKTTVSSCSEFWCLFTPLYETLHFNELSIWLAKSILTHNLRKWLLSDKRFEVKYMMFHWRLFLEKTKKKSFHKAFKLLGYVFLY